MSATHWPASLSPTLRGALATLAATGGKAYPERGGYWRSEPSGAGVRLQKPEARTAVDCLTVQTWRALERRGLVERIENPDPWTRYHPGYQLTAAGRQAAGSNDGSATH